MSKTCGFLDLPPELRNRIYRLRLVKDSPIFPQTAYQWARERVALAFLAVSRQVRSEAFGIYYGLNKFRLRERRTHERDVDAFLRSIGQQGLAHVRSIEFEKDIGGMCTSEGDDCGCCDGWLVEMRLDRRTEKYLQGFWCASVSYGDFYEMITFLQDDISATLRELGISREMEE